MKPRVTTCQIPATSVIAQQLAGAYFSDCYQIPIADYAPSALEIYLSIVVKTPAWVNAMMAMRNRIVSVFGLKNLGHLGTLKKKSAASYQVGDRVGIFSLLYLSDEEIILGDSDKHLDVKVSVCKQSKGAQHAVTLATVVHIHNTLGRVYMFFVAPVHKIIAPAVLART